VTSPTSTAPSAKALPSASEAPERTIQFSLKTKEGWEYAGSVPLPRQSISASKNIASSAPGQAKLELHVTGDNLGTMTFSDTNPGRPNGPKFTVYPGSYAYEVPYEGFVAGGHAVAPSKPNPCEWAGNQGSTEGAHEPFGSALTCRGGTSASGLSEDAPEHGVDEAIRIIGHETPLYIVNFSAGADSACNIFISASGHIRKPVTWKYVECEPVHVRVSG